MKKLIFRILITVCFFVILLFLTEGILKFKSDKEKNLNKWSWKREDVTLLVMLNNKYHSEDSSNFPIVLMKNEDIPEKNDDEKRILVIGDSFTYGYSGSNVNYTWWKQLNLQIKKAGYSNVNVYATGRFLLNTKDELEKVIKNKALMEKINPDLIIIGYVYNDPEQRDENGINVIRGDWEPNVDKNVFYKKFPYIYDELKERYVMSSLSDYNKLKKIGDLLGGYRYDVRSLMLASGESLEKYKDVLKELDDYVKNLEIPYFYYFTENIENELITRASMNVYNAMKELKIKAYYTPYTWNQIELDVENREDYIFFVNPVDYHPGIIWTYDCSKKVFDILKKDYDFLFKDAIIDDIDNIDLNINDTMPFLEVRKESKNVFEFEYPIKENSRHEYTTNFLYYPIKKEYIKLNLEYPKKISKIIVKGENLKNVELYVNTIDEKFGYDINEARQVLTYCKFLGNNTYEVNEEITSLNISIEFYNESNRNIKIEFVEE